MGNMRRAKISEFAVKLATLLLAGLFIEIYYKFTKDRQELGLFIFQISKKSELNYYFLKIGENLKYAMSAMLRS